MPSSAPSDSSSENDTDYDFNDLSSFPEAESASLDKPINSSNIGYQLLVKMGWQSGSGLGGNRQGRVDPVPIDFNYVNSTVGLGKPTEEFEIGSVAGQQRMLNSVRIANESNEETELRLAKVAKEESIKKEVEEMNKSFYCEICDKGYTKISEYENHLSSYEHNHAKRWKELKAQEREQKKKSGLGPSKSKERKRDEKELMRIMQAAGVPVDSSTEEKQSTTSSSNTASVKPTLFSQPKKFQSFGMSSRPLSQKPLGRPKSTGLDLHDDEEDEIAMNAHKNGNRTNKPASSGGVFKFQLNRR